MPVAAAAGGHGQRQETEEFDVRQTHLAAVAIVIATASGAACGGSSPTLSNLPADEGPRVPDVPPTDTSGFIPPPMFP